MKRLAALLTITAMTFALAGCQSNEPVQKEQSEQPEQTAEATSIKELEQKEDLPIEIVESGYTYSPAEFEGAGNYVHYAFLFKNPNTDTFFFLPKFRVTAYGEDDSVLATNDDVLNQIHAGGTYAESNLMEVSSEPARVEFEFIGSETGSHKGANFEPYFHEVSNVSMVDSSIMKKATGEVISAAPEPTTIRVDVIARDESGAIIGGGFTFVDSAQPGANTPFEVMFFDSNIEPATIEAYAQDW